MKRFVVASLLSLFSLPLFPDAVKAMPKFKEAFDKKYVKEHENDDFKKIVAKETCNVCHVKGKKKAKAEEHLNSYGKELEKLIEGHAQGRINAAKAADGTAGEKKEREKLLEELEMAFDEVAKLKSKSGELFGDLIKSGKLPGAEK